MKKELSKRIVSFLSEHGAEKILLFGSYATGKQKTGSDIDLLVRFEEDKSLLELVRIERQLSNKVGKRIDLLTEKSLSPYIARKIAHQTRVLYA